MRFMLLVPVLVVLFARSASAQWLPAPFVTLRGQAPRARQALSRAPGPGHPVPAVLGGVVGGAAGLFAGGMVGAAMESDCHCDDLALAGIVYGGLIGESVGLALGTHLGDGRGGNFALDLLTSAAGAGLGLALAAGENGGAALISVAALQVVLVAAVEVGAARQKATGP